jgi:hypothetical protein
LQKFKRLPKVLHLLNTVQFVQVSESKVDVFICKAGDVSCKTSEVKEGLEKPKWVVLERDPSDTQVRGVIT